ncbi:MAG TPA: YncE family protein [Xanthobacteraceae bacterium]|jgi:DNA-binding beta-propeller fold protein YncE|nr:YncE family protein [Xanthobacteraceae bacterium]
MKYPISRIHAVMVAGAIAALPLFPLNAAAQIAVSSNDGKVILVNGVVGVPANPIDDTVTIINLGVSPPKIIAEFKAPSSVAGPPQNVAVAPDESFALVASSMKLDPADPKKQVPDNRLSVIDLKAKPPAVIATLESGLGPNGLAINKAGTLALVANRHEGTVSIFTIAGNKLTAAGKVDFGDPKSSPSSVAFTPDGKTALVTRDGDHRISVLSVDGSTVTDTKRIMTGGHRPYAIEVSPKGDIAVVGNQGANAGDIMPVNVIDLTGKAPRIVSTVDVGQYIEDLAFSDDGKFLAVIPQNGSNLTPSHPFYNDHGLLVVFSVNGTKLTKVAEVNIGKWPQGVAWSRDGKTLLAQSMVDNALAVVSFNGKSLKVTGQLKVTGGPDGIRTAGH